MEKEKFVLFFSSGASSSLGLLSRVAAVITAANAAKKDPGVMLVKITPQGGEVIDFRKNNK